MQGTAPRSDVSQLCHPTERTSNRSAVRNGKLPQRRQGYLFVSPQFGEISHTVALACRFSGCPFVSLLIRLPGCLYLIGMCETE